jgi:CRP/FNR family transcriptional regulator, cyclic AMP receptor protein
MVSKQVAYTVKEEVRLLSGVDFLEPLSEEELEKLAQRCPDLRFEPNEIICTPHDHSHRFFVLKEGRVRIYKLSPKGHQQTIAEISDGTVLAGQRLQETYVQASEPTTLVSLYPDDVERLIESNPKVAMRIIETLCRRLRMADERLADVALKEVPARLASLILQLLESEGIVTPEGYEIPTRYTHEVLGTMIGAKRVAVSRAFGELREAGAIRTRGRRIHVPDIELLARCAHDERRAQRLKEVGS